MTESRLLTLVRLSPLMRDAGLTISPDEIDAAASLAQSEILSECEPIEVLKTFNLVAGQELYVATAQVLTWLPEVGRIRDPMFYTDATKGKIDKKSREWVDQDRQRIASGGSQPSPPRYFYTLLTEPKTIGFWGIPTSILEVNIRYVRAHASTDNINGRSNPPVHPLVPDTFEKCLKLGTIYNIFEDRLDKFAGLAKMTKTIFQEEKDRMKMKRTLSNVAATSRATELNWT